jgi:nitroreductase / dihydropteridine reductase
MVKYMEKIELSEALSWRYATKRMINKKLSEDELNAILNAIRLAPTSRGLQPFKVIVIDNDELKIKIQPIADNQHQVIECSHLLVFAAWSTISAKQIDDLIQYVATERGISVAKLEKMKSVLVNDQLPMNDEQFYNWASKQIYIALAFAMATAATHKIDAGAMEGFLPKELDKLLQLDRLGLRSVVLLALGFRDVETDWLVHLKKVRRPNEELFIQLDKT